MNLTSFVILLSAVASAAVGQVMLKHGMVQAKAFAATDHESLARSAVLNPWVLSGLVVFGLSAIAWLTTLSRVPLNLAYPFNALGYLAILGASVVVLHERANAWTLVGSSMVVGGLIVIVVLGSACGVVGLRPRRRRQGKRTVNLVWAGPRRGYGSACTDRRASTARGWARSLVGRPQRRNRAISDAAISHSRLWWPGGSCSPASGPRSRATWASGTWAGRVPPGSSTTRWWRT